MNCFCERIRTEKTVWIVLRENATRWFGGSTYRNFSELCPWNSEPWIGSNFADCLLITFVLRSDSSSCLAILEWPESFRWYRNVFPVKHPSKVLRQTKKTHQIMEIYVTDLLRSLMIHQTLLLWCICANPIHFVEWFPCWQVTCKITNVCDCLRKWP